MHIVEPQRFLNFFSVKQVLSFDFLSLVILVLCKSLLWILLHPSIHFVLFLHLVKRSVFRTQRKYTNSHRWTSTSCLEYCILKTLPYQFDQVLGFHYYGLNCFWLFWSFSVISFLMAMAITFCLIHILYNVQCIDSADSSGIVFNAVREIN